MTKPPQTRFKAVALSLPEILLVTSRQFPDDRGYFSETFRKNDFFELGIREDFVQENLSLSARRGTIRGLHYQAPPHAQAKLLRAASGAIFDVVVDIRRGSPTYGRWCAATLTAAGGESLYVPRGFAHGFCCLEENTAVAYKVDNYYARDAEGGIIWNDADIAIEWPVKPQDAVLSAKDATLPRLADIESPFEFGRS